MDFAAEESGCCQRQFCQSGRGFTLHITDNNNQEVLTMTRPFKCFGGCCCWFQNIDCCAEEIEVKAYDGTTIGFVRQTASAWKSKYAIMNEHKQVVLRIE